MLKTNQQRNSCRGCSGRSAETLGRFFGVFIYIYYRIPSMVVCFYLKMVEIFSCRKDDGSFMDKEPRSKRKTREAY